MRICRFASIVFFCVYLVCWAGYWGCSPPKPAEEAHTEQVSLTEQSTEKTQPLQESIDREQQTERATEPMLVDSTGEERVITDDVSQPDAAEPTISDDHIVKPDVSEPIAEQEPDQTPRDTTSPTDGFATPPGCNPKHRCVFDAECGAELICIDGSCQKGYDCPSGGGRCQCDRDADCTNLKPQCDLGLCQSPDCKSDCDCGPSFYCDPKQKCQRCQATCHSDADCPNDHLCQKYGMGCTWCIAKAQRNYAETCRTDAECKSGLCVLRMGQSEGLCSQYCDANNACPPDSICQTFDRDYCDVATCGYCHKPDDTFGCISLLSCNTDDDCKNLVTYCSCCNKWKCNRNKRCHMVFGL